MNEINSTPEYLPRWLGPDLADAAGEHPVVVLTGPRQTGKSTLLRHEAPFASWPCRTLDDLDVLRRAREDPASLWAGTENVVLDEVQREPGLLVAVKAAVDQTPRRRFVLSGSANLLLASSVFESLAGRSVFVELGPMTVGEMESKARPSTLADALRGRLPPETELSGISAPDTAAVLVRGFMPPLLRLASERSAVRWWEGYVATYLERELRQLTQVASLPDFRDLMRALALRCGQLLNGSEVARDVGLPQPTAHRYTRLLQVGGLFHAIPAFSRNGTKRLMKTPKAMWLDPGLACYLSGLHDASAVAGAREAGRLFEALVFLHLRSLASLLWPRPALHHWRTVTGVEVDFVAEHGRRLLPIEAKLTTRPSYDDAAGVEAFLAEYPEAAAGLVVHAGTAIRRLSERVAAVPWWWLGGLGAAGGPGRARRHS